MKAIVLTAGSGERMRPLTDSRHKTLLEVGGQAIISRIVAGIWDAGVREIIVVTGYRASEVEAHLRDHHPDIRFHFVRNERYRETNNIFSMALAFERINDDDDDVIVVEGDLVCDAAVFQRITRSPHTNLALVDRYRIGMDGTVVTVEDGVITSVIPPHLQVGDFSFADKYKTLNIYKFSREFCRTTFRKLLAAYAAIDESCYYEVVLGILIYVKKAVVHAEVLDGERWAELDDPNDLRIAEFTFNPAAQRDILDQTAGGYWSYDITDHCFIRNMYFPTPSMLAEIKSNLPALLHNYGSRQSTLDKKLAVFLLCDPERVIVLNGVSQLYPLLGQHFAGQRVLMPAPSFGEYARTFPEHQAYPDRVGVDLDELVRRSEDADVVVLVNPNNPTGTTLSSQWIYAFAAARPGTRVVVDESFLPFSDEPSLVPMLERAPLPNVLVLASLSKSLGVPGARLGYAYTCDPALAAELGRSLPIWNLNSVAEHVLEIALKHRRSLADSYRATARDRAEFAAALERVPAVAAVPPSGGNFLLVSFHAEAAAAAVIIHRLLQGHAIYVKDASDRIADGRAHLRVAVRFPEENRRFVATLAQETASWPVPSDVSGAKWKQVWAAKRTGADADAKPDADTTLERLLVLSGYDTNTAKVTPESWRAYTARIAECAGIRASDRLFEVGSGAGAFLYPLQAMGCQTDGIDYAPGLVDAAKQALPRGRFSVGEARDIDPFDVYDVVLSQGVFLYFPHLAYAGEVLGKMVDKALRTVAVLDVSDAAHEQEALTLRRQSYPPGEYDRRYAGLEHLYIPRDWFQTFAAERGLGCRIEAQFLPGYLSARYRYNVYLDKR